ncbi:hypothetical protein HEP84_55985 [Streptomyces sp. RLB1-33]|nr:hypothetical protein [Streptomyces sp. RLB1-33]
MIAHDWTSRTPASTLLVSSTCRPGTEAKYTADSGHPDSGLGRSQRRLSREASSDCGLRRIVVMRASSSRLRACTAAARSRPTAVSSMFATAGSAARACATSWATPGSVSTSTTPVTTIRELDSRG